MRFLFTCRFWRSEGEGGRWRSEGGAREDRGRSERGTREERGRSEGEAKVERGRCEGGAKEEPPIRAKLVCFTGGRGKACVTVEACGLWVV